MNVRVSIFKMLIFVTYLLLISIVAIQLRPEGWVVSVLVLTYLKKEYSKFEVTGIESANYQLVIHIKNVYDSIYSFGESDKLL